MLRLGRESHVPESSSLQGFLACVAPHSQPAVIALAWRFAFLLLDFVRSEESWPFWRAVPFAAALQAAAGHPIPWASGLYKGALCSRGTGTARQSPLVAPLSRYLLVSPSNWVLDGIWALGPPPSVRGGGGGAFSCKAKLKNKN